MYSYIITNLGLITYTYDNTTGNLEIEPNQLIVLGDEAINTTYLGLADRTVTVANTTVYHLRFSYDGSSINSFAPPGAKKFYLVEVGDSNYNPNNYDVDDPYWFQFYKDILVAKIDATY